MMKRLKLSELPIGSAEVLTREELKKVLGGMGSFPGGGGSGTGTRCAIYCCPPNGSGGDCIFEQSIQMSCSSNEDCQSSAVGGGASCSSGYYVAALCKG